MLKGNQGAALACSALWVLVTFVNAAPLWADPARSDGTATDRPSEVQFPFSPSAQTVPGGKPVSLDSYLSNEVCMRCHQEIGNQWRGSMHSQAMKDPIFLALYRLGHQETKGLTNRLCAGCHSSPLVVSGHGAPDEVDKLPLPVAEGVSCVVCHSIRESHLPAPDALPANGSFVTDPQGPIVGTHDDRPCQQSGRETIKSELHTKSEFCANCHGVVHPLNGFVIEKTYEEWRSSIYAAKGIQCQDCHMQPVELAVATARTLQKVPNPAQVSQRSPQRDHVYHHTFVGGNYLVTKLLGSTQHAEMAEQMLKHAASLELQLPDHIEPGRLVNLRVKVNNETAGHNLPTSLVEVRQMWLDVQVVNAAGAELYRCGAVDAQGNIDSDAVMFHAIAVNEDGQPTVKPWEMTRFTYFHTVPPKGHTLERFAFLVPARTPGPVQVRATLRYRLCPQELANALLGKDAPTIPIVDMASAVKTVELRP
jgi:hypothetical protein